MLLPFLHPILYIYIYIASIPIESISISILTVFDRYLFPFLSFLFFFSPLFSLSLSRVSSCITIISLQLSASSAGELHFCKDAPCTRWVNEPDVSSSCLLFLSLPPTTEVTLFSSFSFFFFYCYVAFFTLRRKRRRRMDVELADGNAQRPATVNIARQMTPFTGPLCMFYCSSMQLVHVGISRWN